MDIFAALRFALPSLATAGNVISGGTYQNIINLALGILMLGVNVVERFKLLDDFVRDMVASGREPTQAEWDALIARSQAAHDKIQNG